MQLKFCSLMRGQYTLNKLQIVCLFIIMGILSGCSTLSGYKPVVDSQYGNVEGAQARLTTDNEECHALAKGGTLRNGMTAGLFGGAVGAGMGASMGAVVTGISVTGGAAAGAAMLAAPFLGYEMWKDNEAYGIAWRTCLRNRGHNVVR